MLQQKSKYKKIVRACIHGKPVAQQELYDLFSSKMLSVCYRYARNKNDAEDIFQSAWLKIFENLKQLRKIELLEWWMKKIFINEALQLYNKAKKVVLTDEDYYFEGANRDDVVILQSFHYDQITQFIQELPNKMRMVFNMYVIEDFSHKEIAEKMEISIGTSKSQLHDARKILQKKIEQLNSSKIVRLK